MNQINLPDTVREAGVLSLSEAALLLTSAMQECQTKGEIAGFRTVANELLETLAVMTAWRKDPQGAASIYVAIHQLNVSIDEVVKLNFNQPAA